MEGRIFISLMKEKNLLKEYTVPELISEIKKIKIVEMENGRRYITEISKKQRKIFEEFGFPIPLT